MPTLLTPSQVATLCGLSRSTLAKRRLQGVGPPFVKIGAAVRYPEAELMAWMDGHPRYTSTAAVRRESAGTNKTARPSSGPDARRR